MYFKVIRITVTSPSDFSVLENFRREMHSWNIACRTGCESAVWISLPKMTKYADKFHFEIPSDWWENCKKILGGFFCRACVLHKQKLGISRHLYLGAYISLRFTQSNSPTHTKFLFSFRNTRISRISRQSVSASSCNIRTQRKHVPPGLWCRCSYNFLGQCGNQWIDCFRRWWHLLLTDMPKGHVGIDQ